MVEYCSTFCILYNANARRKCSLQGGYNEIVSSRNSSPSSFSSSTTTTTTATTTYILILVHMQSLLIAFITPVHRDDSLYYQTTDLPL